MDMDMETNQISVSIAAKEGENLTFDELKDASNEVIDKMELEPLRDRLHHLVEKRFRGELNKCEGCKLCK